MGFPEGGRAGRPAPRFTEQFVRVNEWADDLTLACRGKHGFQRESECFPGKIVCVFFFFFFPSLLSSFEPGRETQD